MVAQERLDAKRREKTRTAAKKRRLCVRLFGSPRLCSASIDSAAFRVYSHCLASNFNYGTLDRENVTLLKQLTNSPTILAGRKERQTPPPPPTIHALRQPQPPRPAKLPRPHLPYKKNPTRSPGARARGPLIAACHPPPPEKKKEPTLAPGQAIINLSKIARPDNSRGEIIKTGRSLSLSRGRAARKARQA